MRFPLPMNLLLMVRMTNVSSLLLMMLLGFFFLLSFICSHFETVADDVLSIYKRIMGHDLDLTLPTEETA